MVKAIAETRIAMGLGEIFLINLPPGADGTEEEKEVIEGKMILFQYPFLRCFVPVVLEFHMVTSNGS